MVCAPADITAYTGSRVLFMFFPISAHIANLFLQAPAHSACEPFNRQPGAQRELVEQGVDGANVVEQS